LQEYSSLFEFLAEARENDKALTKYIPKEVQEQVRKLTEKKKKFVEGLTATFGTSQHKRSTIKFE
jgi:hypothetical protein